MLATVFRMAGAEAFLRTMPFEKRRCEKKRDAAAARWSLVALNWLGKVTCS